MRFVSMQFLVFFLLLIVALNICKHESKRQLILLAASYIFYAYWDYRFLALLLLQTLISYLTGRILLRNRKSKIVLGVGVTAELLVLGYFKYFGFFVKSFCTLFSLTNTLSLHLILPVGISFYTFQAISYMVDAYRGILQKKSTLSKVALYIGFFPNIMSGPILKAHDFLPQLERDHRIEKENLIQGAQIFLLGVIKKNVIADRLGVCVDAVYNAPSAYSWISILIAVIAYSFQIYCDFSGYSDMAIGIGKALGYEFGRNFNCPYIASNLSDFWRRWHISLSSWFKEYVYFPLGGSRKSLAKTLFNLMAVMLLSGLWHGSSWTFVVWGALHGTGAVLQRLYAEWRRKTGHEKSTGQIIHLLCVVSNFVFVSFCWIPFRASSFQNAAAVLKGLVTMQPGIHYIYVYAFVYVGICVCGMLYVGIRKGGNAEYPALDFSKFRSWVILWTVLLLSIVFFYVGNTAFIYSQF